MEYNYSRDRDTNIEALKGLTLASVEGASVGSQSLTLTSTTGRTFLMFHSQDCCESVDLTEIVGDVQDLIGSPLVEAEEVSSEDEPAPEYAESFTWTFYKLGTRKGSVTLRWLGQSNGYYSESVTFVERR